MAAQTRVAWTAIGRSGGRRRTLLIATCGALVLAAVGDEATGYDGPGPFIYLAVAVLVALVRWRFMPLLATVLSVVFLYGGFASAAFTRQLTQPGQLLAFAAGWLQTAGFLAAAVCAVGAVVRAHREIPGHSH